MRRIYINYNERKNWASMEIPIEFVQLIPFPHNPVLKFGKTWDHNVEIEFNDIHELYRMITWLYNKLTDIIMDYMEAGIAIDLTVLTGLEGFMRWAYEADR